VADCPHCGKAQPLCICDSVTPIENKIALLILQHPQEQERVLGTARLEPARDERTKLRCGPRSEFDPERSFSANSTLAA
jgi:DTW domain-containing protein YfiP